jgi:NDP-sugar pyrophosphorylase family protein
MKAVILAAGKGTRMRELTNDLPKPMLKVKGKPILEHILEGIRAAGIREFCIVTGYKAEMVEAHFGDGACWDARVIYARQTVQDGTGRPLNPRGSLWDRGPFCSPTVTFLSGRKPIPACWRVSRKPSSLA